MFISADYTNARKWFYSFLIALGATLLFYNSESSQITMFWFLSFFAIALFAFEPIPNFIIAVMLLLSFVIFGIASPDVVFVGWTTFIPWIMFSGLFIGRLVDKTGFAQRIALKIVSSIAKTPLLLFLSFLIAGYVLNLIIADGFTNTIVLATFALSICKALDLDPASKASSSIMLASYFCGMTIGYNYLPNGLGLIGIQMLKEQGFTVSWLEFLAENFSLFLPSVLGALLILYFYSRKEIAPSMDKTREYATAEYEKLGKVTTPEIKVILLLSIAVSALIFENFHGLPGLFLMPFIVLLAFCPPFNLLERKDIYKVETGMLFFMTGCMSIGFTAGSLGIPAWLSGKLIPVLENITSTGGASLFAYIVGILANFVLTPVAASSSLTVPMADLAIQMGFNIKPMIYSFFMGLDQWFFPYELAPAIYIFATGYLRMKHIFIIMAFRAVLTGIFVWLNGAFIWNSIGI